MERQYSDLRQSDIFSRWANLSYMPRWGVYLLDIFLCALSFLLSVVIGNGLFSYKELPLDMLPLSGQLLLILIVQSLAFWAFHTYSGVLRYSTFIDTLKVLISLIVCGLVLLLSNVISTYYFHFKLFYNSVTIIYVFVSFVFLFTLRVGVKTVFEYVKHNAPGSKRVFIYGTQQAGIAIAKMLRSSGESEYNPVGFIEDDITRKQRTLVGLRVYYKDERLIYRMRQRGVRHVIVSPLKMRSLQPGKDLAVFFENNIHVLTTPYFTEWDENDKNNRIGKIDAIQIEDLLERPTIDIDTENVRQVIGNKVVMVTGAAGSIGSELVRQALKYKPKALVLFEQAESPLHDLTLDLTNSFPDMRIISCIGDVRNKDRVEEVMRDMRPDVVFHAAAYKHVPLMENHPNESIQANVLGTKNVADMAVKYGVKRFVMISTDKAVNPTNIMGASKRIAEIYVQSLFYKLQKENPDCTKFITTRFGNVLGSNGSVIPYFKKQIAAGGPVTVTHPDIIRYFMTIPEACCLVLEACTLGKGGEIFVFDMGHAVKILDLAKNMIRLAGLTPGKDIQIVFTGLRPGEKLYEELLNQKEKTLPTKNSKIMIAQTRQMNYDEIEPAINNIIAESRKGKPFITVMLMKQLVPEFVSRNSIYEQLDQ